MSGSASVIPIHGRCGSPSTSSSSRRAVRLASIRSIGGRRQPSGLLLGDGPAVRFAEELRLHPEIDRARRDVEREALRLEVVLHERHRERQEQPAPEATAATGEVAVDDRPGQRPARRIEAAHAAQAQERPLAADGRRRPGPRGPGAGQRLGPFREAIERPERRGRSAHRRPLDRSERRVSGVDAGPRHGLLATARRPSATRIAGAVRG